MIADWLIAFMYGSLMFFLDFFPRADFLNIPTGVYALFKGVGNWVDMGVAGQLVAMMVSIYAAYGMAFLMNWLIKRFRGG